MSTISGIHRLTQEELDNVVKSALDGGDPLTIRGCFISDDIVFPKELEHVSFAYCNFAVRTISNTVFSDCCFTNCSMDDVCFYSCVFERCSFYRVSLCCVRFLECKHDHTTMGYCDAERLLMNMVDMESCNFYFTNFNISTFSSCNVVKLSSYFCEFTESEIHDTDFNIESHVPDTGSFVAWKKAMIKKDYKFEYYIVKLIIPEDARRSNAGANKCRADKAIVEDIQDMEGNSVDIIVNSMWDSDFKYEKGKVVEEHDFCTDRLSECARGIHFFLNRDDAVHYEL